MLHESDATVDAPPETGELQFVDSVAQATRSAPRLQVVAPAVLRATCEHLGWGSAALVTWSADGDNGVPVAHVVCSVGRWSSGTKWDEVLRPLAPSAAGSVMRARVGDRDFVIAGLAPSAGVSAAALVFGDVTADRAGWRALITLVASECGHVTERESFRQRLRASAGRFQRIFEASPLAKGLVVGNGTVFDEVNEALCTLTGHSRTELLAVAPLSLVHPDDHDRVRAMRLAAIESPEERQVADVAFLRASGESFPGRLTLTSLGSAGAMATGGDELTETGETGEAELLVQIEDLTSRLDTERRLRRQAEVDPLTGLANRFGLVGELDRIEAESLPCAVIFMDLDGFKLINDTRGHEIGDEVLAEVASRIRQVTGQEEFVGRFGGDEFVVICRPNQGSGRDGSAGELRASVCRVADSIQQILTAPIDTSTGPVYIHTSIGICDGTIPARIPSAQLQRADTAMYQAKRLGKDRQVVYDATLHERAVEYRRTDSTLRNALAEKRFVLHYQPIVDTDTGSVRGFEALVRLIDGDGRLVAPGTFISVAEQSGLIVPLGGWILREACRRISELRREVDRPIFVSVNVSARQAARADLPDTVRDALTGSGLPASALTLELTESALLESDSATLQRLTSLQQQGVHIALDDFGTGYSSLTYLQQLPLSHIKVDRSFVSGIATSHNNASIVQAVTWLAHSLGLEWIAEGVETREEWSALQNLGHGLAQGYLFNRPLPSHLLAHAVRAEHRVRPQSST